MTYYKEVDGASKDVVLGYVTFTNATKEVCDCISHVLLNCQSIVICHQQKLLQWPISERIQNRRYFHSLVTKLPMTALLYLVLLVYLNSLAWT